MAGELFRNSNGASGKGLFQKSFPHRLDFRKSPENVSLSFSGGAFPEVLFQGLPEKKEIRAFPLFPPTGEGLSRNSPLPQVVDGLREMGA